MEDLLDTGYSANDLWILNNWHMFLQITTLAEITDHTRNQLLPKACLHGSNTPSLQSISTSTLQWLTQPNPDKPAWSLWTWVLWTLYTKPGLHYQLNHPLGPWKFTAATIWTWNYQINPISHMVYKTTNARTQWHPLQWNIQNYTYYFPPVNQANQSTPNNITLHPVTTEFLKMDSVSPNPTHPFHLLLLLLWIYSTQQIYLKISTPFFHPIPLDYGLDYNAMPTNQRTSLPNV